MTDGSTQLAELGDAAFGQIFCECAAVADELGELAGTIAAKEAAAAPTRASLLSPASLDLLKQWGPNSLWTFNDDTVHATCDKDAFLGTQADGTIIVNLRSMGGSVTPSVRSWQRIRLPQLPKFFFGPCFHS